MTRGARLAACWGFWACLVVSSVCRAEGFLDGPEHRYPRQMLPLRTAADLLAIPAGIPDWSKGDWAVFTLTTSAVVSLMIDTPWGEAADLRFQRWMRLQLRDTPRPLIWTHAGDAAIWSGIWVPTLGAFLYGYGRNLPRLMESVSLTIEAFSVAELYHLFFKALLGREGPAQDGGRVLGPAGFLRLFPAGTPSGHAAALYAMLGSLSTYWKDPRFTAGLHLFGALFAASLIVDDYHYVSDVLWGAVMGWFIGRWVVDHRAARDGMGSAAREARSARREWSLTFLPEVAPRRGRYGLSAAIRF